MRGNSVSTEEELALKAKKEVECKVKEELSRRLSKEERKTVASYARTRLERNFQRLLSGKESTKWLSELGRHWKLIEEGKFDGDDLMVYGELFLLEEEMLRGIVRAEELVPSSPELQVQQSTSGGPARTRRNAVLYCPTSRRERPAVITPLARAMIKKLRRYPKESVLKVLSELPVSPEESGRVVGLLYAGSQQHQGGSPSGGVA
ncbi:MAG: hypothetical protein PHF51_00190 [Candidatus ainarchaeum sp.]|nr:hypothetical protein [Candidatus ainarchaeum sp.]